MTISTPAPSQRLAGALQPADFTQFQKICAQQTDASAFPLASVSEQIPIFDSTNVLPLIRGSTEERYSVMEQFQRALLTGPGVFVVKNLVPTSIIDKAEVITEQVNPRQEGSSSKASRRTFAYSEKHAKHDPESFAEYYGNDLLAAVCESWLGPGYQITATTNATFVGGDQQAIHRDYHVSHQTMDRIHRFPLINQIASQFLTLQAAIAHTDMPLSTGPTRFLPFSQQFDKGYISVQDPQYLEWTKPRMVQLPLNKGDAVFFNPATFHQPGVNVTDGERVANLLQVSAAFGRSMESCDRLGMSKSVFPVMKRWDEEIKDGKSDKSKLQLEALIAATASDYGYPHVIDNAVRGSPNSQAELIKKALEEGTETNQVLDALEAYQSWHKP